MGSSSNSSHDLMGIYDMEKLQDKPPLSTQMHLTCHDMELRRPRTDKGCIHSLKFDPMRAPKFLLQPFWITIYEGITSLCQVDIYLSALEDKRR